MVLFWVYEALGPMEEPRKSFKIKFPRIFNVKFPLKRADTNAIILVFSLNRTELSFILHERLSAVLYTN